MQAFRKYCLVNGFDDISLTLRHADKIKAFEAQRLADSIRTGIAAGVSPAKAGNRLFLTSRVANVAPASALPATGSRFLPGFPRR